MMVRLQRTARWRPMVRSAQMPRWPLNFRCCSNRRCCLTRRHWIRHWIRHQIRHQIRHRICHRIHRHRQNRRPKMRVRR